MWRICLLLIVMVPTGALAGGEPQPADADQVSHLYCPVAPAVQGATMKVSGGGVSLLGLAGILGTGLLSLLCLIPVALLSELLMGRDKAADGGLRVV